MQYKPRVNLLKNRIILVTGASSGIGREAAITYARYGASVILLGRNSKKLSAVAQQIINENGIRVFWFILDLLTCTYSDCESLARDISLYYPKIDGLLHNAGLLGEICRIEKQDPKIWQQVIQVNVNSTFFLTKALLPLLLKSNSGSLVFTSSSIVEKRGRANWGAYTVSKFAIEGMMQVLAKEYQDRHLRVNCINPGSVRTKMRAEAFPEEDQSKLKDPADIMSLYLWLMSNDSRDTNGITINAY